MNTADSRLRHIDGLRATAVLMVVVHHATTHSVFYTGAAAITPWVHLALEGAHGVDLFFVLSGFCLSYPVLARIHRFGTTAFSLDAYAARRIIRIVPPYYAVILLFTVLSAVPLLHIGRPPWPDVLRQAEFMDWQTEFSNGSFWTLSVEFRWYFLFPAALALWAYSRRLFLAVAVAVVSAYLTTRLRSIDLGVLLPFLLGIVAAECYLRPRPWFRYAAVAAPAAMLAGIALEPHITAPSPFGGEMRLLFMQTNVGWQTAMFLLVLLCGYAAPLRQVLSWPPLVAIGIASYSIYLVHEPLVQRLDLLLPQNLALECAVGLTASVIVGAFFWLAAERPWLHGRLRNYAVDRMERLMQRVFKSLDVPRSFILRAGNEQAVAESEPPQTSSQYRLPSVSS